MTININWTDKRKAQYLAIAKATGIFALCMFAGFWIGVFVLWVLTALFGAKLGAMIYVVLWGASMIWIFLTIFERDAYGFRK